MKNKTEIEKIIDAIEKKDQIKEKGKKFVPHYKLDNWNNDIENAVYNENQLKPYEMFVKLQYGLQRGLSIKDALYIAKHRYKDVPIDKAYNIMCEYSKYGQRFVEENRFYTIKKRIVLKRK